jgi:hypothetical protein
MAGIRIQDAPLVEQLKLDDKLPISNGSGQAVTANISQIKQVVTEGLATVKQLNDKVDKVDGKQLSTQDFTTALKEKLQGLSNYDDTTLTNAISTLRADFNALVSGDTTTAIKTFNEVIAFLDGITDTQDLAGIIASIERQIAGKQNTIEDLEAIRQGAAKGATALQSIPEQYVTEDKLQGYATTDSVNSAIASAITNALNTEV